MKPNLVDIDIYDKYMLRHYKIDKHENNLFWGILILFLIALILYLYYDKKNNNRVSQKDFYSEINSLIKDNKIPIHVPIHIETNEYGKLPLYNIDNPTIIKNNTNNFEFTENDDSNWF